MAAKKTKKRAVKKVAKVPKLKPVKMLAKQLDALVQFHKDDMRVCDQHDKLKAKLQKIHDAAAALSSKAAAHGWANVSAELAEFAGWVANLPDMGDGAGWDAFLVQAKIVLKNFDKGVNVVLKVDKERLKAEKLAAKEAARAAKKAPMTVERRALEALVEQPELPRVESVVVQLPPPPVYAQPPAAQPKAEA